MKRKKLKGLLKVLVFAALVLLLVVFFKSLFPSVIKSESREKQTLVEIDLQGMKSGEIRKIRFEGKEVGILKRREITFPDMTTEKMKYKLPDPSLEKNSRSRLPDYFVYYNSGDSGNCPLFHDEMGFKDICSQKVFDNTGREKGKEQQGFVIKIPPHSFKVIAGKATTLLIGQW